jgi:hypothetical protein
VLEDLLERGAVALPRRLEDLADRAAGDVVATGAGGVAGAGEESQHGHGTHLLRSLRAARA